VIRKLDQSRGALERLKAIGAVTFCLLALPALAGAATPTVSGFSPLAGPVGSVVTVSGVALSGSSAVVFEGGASATATLVAATSLRVVVPAGATTGLLTVMTPTGPVTSAKPFHVTPKITGFAPVTGIAGDQITISGFNLVSPGSATVVQVGATPAILTDATATAITFTIPAAAITARLSVRTPEGTATAVGNLDVIRRPTVTGFQPAAGTVGQVVTLSGTQLKTVTGITFNGTPATILAGQTVSSLRVTVPAGATTGPIVATNPAGSGGTLAQFRLLPKIAGFAPDRALPNTSVTISGFNLTDANVSTLVRVGAVVATVTEATSTSVTFTVPATAISARVSVATKATATSVAKLIVIRAPTVTAFSPAVGPVGAVVTASGTNLDSVTTVTFNGTPASAFTVLSATSLRATVPPGATTGSIGVTNEAGSAATLRSFRTSPRVIGFFPPSAVPGEPVTVTGFNLQVGTTNPTVRVGALAAGVTSATPTSMTLTVPVKGTTGRITVITADGTGLSPTALTVLQATVPRPQAMDPGAATVGSMLTVSGTGLSLSSRVTFTGGATATPTTAIATVLKVVVPSGAQSGPITITNPMGSGTTTSSFTALPRITDVSPRGAVAGAALTIVGTNLKVAGDHPQVTVGGVGATVTASSPTVVVVTVPAGGLTGPVRLTTVDGTATSASAVIVAPLPVVEAALHKTTSRTGTVDERVVDVRFRPQPGDFFRVTVSDGVLLVDEPLVLHGQFSGGGRPTDDFRLRRVLTDTEDYPPADRQFTVVATPAGGGAPLVFQTTQQTLGAVDPVTIFQLDNPRVSAAPTTTDALGSPSSAVVGLVDEGAGTVIEVLGCLGPGCSFTSLGSVLSSPPFWVFNSPVPLTAGDRIKARATAPGKFTGLNSSTITVLSTGQLRAPTIIGPILTDATSVFGLAPSGSSVELFTRTPVPTSLGLATTIATFWQVDGLSPLQPGQELFAVARLAGFTDSPPADPVFVGAPVEIARFDVPAVVATPITIAVDVGGISTPIVTVRLLAHLTNSDGTFLCTAQQDFEVLAGPAFSLNDVTLPSVCIGSSGPQAAATIRVCVEVIDDQARQSDHCLVFD